jgi:ABC-type nitrate/sulfonate/bicarbonate transport system substrate-binding protein
VARPFIAAIVSACVALSACGPGPKKDDVIKVGWMTTIEGQGQTVEVLKTTDILERNNLKVAWTPFLIGPPMVDAALAGRLDIIAAAAQPTLALVSRDQNWKIVARRNTLRHAIVVPPDSSLGSLHDLVGKKVGVAVGTNVEIYLISAIREVGLDPSQLNIVNVAPPEDAELIRNGSNAAWGDFAAFVIWDPVLGVLENQGKVRPIAQTMMPFYVSIRTGASDDYESLVEKYTCALRQAWLTYSGDPGRYDKLYSQDTSISVEPAVFLKIDELETNMKAKPLSDIDISITPGLLNDLNLTAGIMKEKKRLDQAFDVNSAIYKLDPDPAHKCQ